MKKPNLATMQQNGESPMNFGEINPRLHGDHLRERAWFLRVNKHIQRVFLPSDGAGIFCSKIEPGKVGAGVCGIDRAK